MPLSRPRAILGEELDLLRGSLKRALGFLTPNDQLPAEINSGRWERLWRACAGDVEEACRVARYGQRQCADVGKGITLGSILKNYADWCPASHQIVRSGAVVSAIDGNAAVLARIAGGQT